MSKGGTLIPRKRAAATLPHYQKNSAAAGKPSKASKQATAPSKAAPVEHPKKEAVSLTSVTKTKAPATATRTTRGRRATTTAGAEEDD